VSALRVRSTDEPKAPESGRVGPAIAAATGQLRRIVAPVKKRHRDRAPGIKLNCGAGSDVPHVGIVFVHGIGSQLAGETLLDWGVAIIRVLLDARLSHSATADPVIDVQLDPGPSESRFIEVQLPKGGAEGEIPEQHWVMTEAWWAQRIRPPAFGQMAQWLGTGGAITRIVDSLLDRKHGVGDPRLRPAIQPRPLRRARDSGVEEAPVDPKEVTPPLHGSGVGRAAAAFGGNLYLQAVSALLLVLYGLLRTIEKLVPIGPLKDGALTRPLDGFVLDWFGDVYVLLADPAQAASVRGRLVDALEDLDAARCDQVAIVAHSGGAIVSYMTLADTTRHLHVDRLITLGEGLNLAWHLIAGKKPEGAEEAAVQYDRLYLNVLKAYPNLRWDDFWASQDPAPVGVLDFSSFPKTAVPDDRDLERITSHSTWNRLSIGQDHGAYWENDEEFLIPVLRLLEGRDEHSALFGGQAEDTTRSNKRRRRLSMLSLLRQTCLVAPMAGIVTAFAIGSRTTFDVSDGVAKAWSWIPGTKFLSDAIDYLRGLRLEDVAAMRFLAETGVWVVAAAIAGTAAFSLLAPPERPRPWPFGGGVSTVVRHGLEILPYVAAIPVLIAVGYGAVKFLSGSTVSALDVGTKLLVGVVAVGLLGIGLYLIAGRRATEATGWRYAVYVILMVTFMVIGCGLVVAPVVAAIVFPDAGRMIVGSLVIVLAFQVIARVGDWRWAVWDAHERAVARTGQGDRGMGRVVSQILLLAAILAAAFVAVVFDSIIALAVAGVVVAALVLVGVAIDVLDAVRMESESPAASIRENQFRH
jgi:hypothetical protein